MEEYYIFQGALVGWLIGLPFLIIIFLIRSDYRINLLLMNINNFASPDQIINHLTYLLRLISLQSEFFLYFLIIFKYIFDNN